MSCLALGHDARSSHQHDRQSIEISGMRRHNEDGSVLSRRLLAPHSDPVETPKQEEQSHDPAHQYLRMSTTKHHHTWLLDKNRTHHNAVKQAYGLTLDTAHWLYQGVLWIQNVVVLLHTLKLSFVQPRKTRKTRFLRLPETVNCIKWRSLTLIFSQIGQ